METQIDKTLQNKKLDRDEIEKTILAVLSFDTKQKQADNLGISRQALYQRLVNYPEIDSFIRELSKISSKLLAIATLKASENLIRLLDHPNPRISLKASCEILDRTGVTNYEEVRQPVPIMGGMSSLFDKYKD